MRPPPRGTPTSIRTYLIFPETRVIGLHFCCCMYGSIFIQFCAVGSKRRIFSAPECVLAVQGRSGSSKVDDFDTNRKRICDFLLVRHCDYGAIVEKYAQITLYRAKLKSHFLSKSTLRQTNCVRLHKTEVSHGSRRFSAAHLRWESRLEPVPTGYGSAHLRGLAWTKPRLHFL